MSRPGFLKVAGLALLGALHGCTHLASDVIVMDRVVTPTGGASKVLPVDTPTRLPAGEYSADWTWHDDIGVCGWHRFEEDLVAFRGSCTVRVD